MDAKQKMYELLVAFISGETLRYRLVRPPTSWIYCSMWHIARVDARVICNTVQTILQREPGNVVRANAYLSKFPVFENQFEYLLFRQARKYCLLQEWLTSRPSFIRVLYKGKPMQLNRKTHEPSIYAMHQACPLYFGRTRLAIDGLAGVCMEAMPVRTSSSHRTSFVSSYDGFIITHDELERLPFHINTPYDLDAKILNRFEIKSQEGELVLVGNPLGVGPMFNHFELFPGYDSPIVKAASTYAPNCHAVHGYKSTTSASSSSSSSSTESFSSSLTPGVLVHASDRISLSSLCITIERLANVPVDEAQIREFGTEEAFFDYTSSHDSVTTAHKKKEETIASIVSHVNEQGMFDEPCYICFRTHQSVENQLIKCRAKSNGVTVQCTRVYHQACLEPYVRFKTHRQREQWECPLHVAADTWRIVHPCIAPFYPRWNAKLSHNASSASSASATLQTVERFPDGDETQYARASSARVIKTKQAFTFAMGKKNWPQMVYWGISDGTSAAMYDRSRHVDGFSSEQTHNASHRYSLATCMGLSLRAHETLQKNILIALDHPVVSDNATSLWSTIVSNNWGTGVLEWLHFGVVEPNDPRINVRIEYCQKIEDLLFEEHHPPGKRLNDVMLLPLIVRTLRTIEKDEALYMSNFLYISLSQSQQPIFFPYFMQPGKIDYWRHLRASKQPSLRTALSSDALTHWQHMWEEVWPGSTAPLNMRADELHDCKKAIRQRLGKWNGWMVEGEGARPPHPPNQLDDA